jgi:hypothetical protein
MLTMVRILPRPTSGRICDTARYPATQPPTGLVTDATAAFGSEGMKAAATKAPMIAHATEAFMSRLPIVNG